MFTGIIQELGSIKLLKNGLYEIITNLDLTDCIEGSSISCNGVCLTAINIKKNYDNSFSFQVNIGEETLIRTNFGRSPALYHTDLFRSNSLIFMGIELSILIELINFCVASFSLGSYPIYIVYTCVINNIYKY